MSSNALSEAAFPRSHGGCPRHRRPRGCPSNGARLGGRGLPFRDRTPVRSVQPLERQQPRDRGVLRGRRVPRCGPPSQPHAGHHDLEQHPARERRGLPRLCSVRRRDRGAPPRQLRRRGLRERRRQRRPPRPVLPVLRCAGLRSRGRRARLCALYVRAVEIRWRVERRTATAAVALARSASRGFASPLRRPHYLTHSDAPTGRTKTSSI